MPKVVLIHPYTGKEHIFDKEHAERIMALPNPGGWTYKKQPKAKKAKNASNSRTAKGEASIAEEPEEDCGCD